MWSPVILFLWIVHPQVSGRQVPVMAEDIVRVLPTAPAIARALRAGPACSACSA